MEKHGKKKVVVKDATLRFWGSDIPGSKKRLEAIGHYYLQRKYLEFLLNLVKRYPRHIGDSDIFEGMNPISGEEDQALLLFECEWWRRDRCFLNKENVSPDEVGGFLESEVADSCFSDMARRMWNNARYSGKFKRAFKSLLERYIGELEELVAEAGGMELDFYYKRFRELRDVFGFDELESDCVILLFLVQGGYLNTSDMWGRFRGNSTRYMLASALLGIPEEGVRRLFSKEERLIRMGCVDGGEFALDDTIRDFLNGSTDKPLKSALYSENPDEALPWDYYGESIRRHGEVLKKMLLARRGGGRGLNILLYGLPGTGKSSFAATLARECGLNAYKIEQGRASQGQGGPDYSTAFRFGAVHVCDGQLDPKSSLVVVDESDKLLSNSKRGILLFASHAEPEGDKGALNAILDETRVSRIWIANVDASAIDPSCRRRFDYSLRFDKLSAAQRGMVWLNAAERRGVGDLISKAAACRLASKYDVEPGGVDLAVRNLSEAVSASEKSMGEAEGLTIIEAVMERHCELLGLVVGAWGSSTTEEYSLENLNVHGDISPERVAAAVEEFMNSPSLTSRKALVQRMNILLFGPPGTGKTEFAKYLAESSGKELVRRTGADLLDMYVGGTERKIRAAFQEAESKNAILLIDEFEGVARSRGIADKSWEISRVNELLCQMESFNGVFVASTNIKNSLDSATIRRFLFKLRFDYLDDDGKVAFYKRFFGELNGNQMSANELEGLRSMDSLTPGDFKIVLDRFLGLGFEKVEHSAILAELTEERMAKNEVGKARIGFA